MLRFITILYLFIPYFIFFFGWLKLFYALPLCILLSYSLFQVYRTSVHSTDSIFPFGRRHGMLLLLVVLLWVMLSGIGGIGYQTGDYRKHNVIFNDLIVSSWPVHYQEGIEGQPIATTLVYYLAFYLPAALAGKVFMWEIANILWFAWAYVGFALSMIWFTKFVGRKSLWVMILFIFAGGLDVFGYLWFKGEIMPGTYHVEWWAKPLQYPANSSLLAFVPQHAIGGWLATALVLHQILQEKSCKFLGLYAIAACFWSPFACIGLFPFLVFGVFKNRFREILTVHNFVLPPLIAIVVGLFFKSLVYPVSGAFVNLAELWPKILLFLFLEVGLYFYLCFNSKDLFKGDRGVLITSALTLFFMPVYELGLFNDYLTRGSIPALFVLWIFVAKAGFNSSHPQSLLVARTLIVVLFLGCFSGVSELTRSIVNYSVLPPPQEQLDRLPAYLRPLIAKQYLGNPNSVFFQYLARGAPF